ncbi:MAG: glycosyltransferase family 2 protein [Candidatus ainarchaeum sp.]|nr:glycosyltransferase family 2 protein [Candidatus ainarchaeum sp.]
MPSVSILLPTLNEAESIGRTITEVRAAVPQAEIVVIDGLSTDRTVEIAKSLGARILLEKRKGKAFAIKAAFREIDSDYAVMIDADLTYPVKDIQKFLSLLKDYDVVLGSRFKGHFEEGAMPPINGFGNQMISLVATVLYLKPVSDVCTGMWAFRKNAYKAIDVTAHTFELECNLFAQSVKKGLRMTEVPIDYARRGGTSKVQLMDGVKDCIFLLKERFRP